MLDNALFLFEMANNDNFSIQRNRFIAALPELLPFLAIKLSIPMKGLLIAWSVGFMAYHAACYVICGILKNYKLGICLLLSHTMILSHSFFWHLSELQLGISLLFPFLALAINKGRPLPFYIRYPLLLVLLITLAFSHPIFTLAFVYVIVFAFVNKHAELQKNLLLGISLVFTGAIIVQNIFFFDSHGLSSTNNIVNLFPHYINTYANKRLLINIRLFYYWLPVFSIIVFIVYARQRKWLNLLLVFTALAAYLFLVNVSFYHSGTPDFYKENLYVILSLILAFPLVYNVLPTVKNKMLIHAVFALFLATTIYRVYDLRTLYKGRIDTYRGAIAETGSKKIIAPFSGRIKEPMIMEWASPYEFWLLSTLEKDSTASIVIHLQPESLLWTRFERKAFLTPWGLFPYDALNPVYFKFRDTNTRYVMYEYK